jgi:hypothetical protein
MSAVDPLVPRKQDDLDEEIVIARKRVRDIGPGRRLVMLAVAPWFLTREGLLAAWLARRNGNWGGWAFLFGVFGAVGVAFFAEKLDGSEPGFSREKLCDASRDRQQLALRQRELSIGSARGRTAACARYREAMPDLIARYRSQSNSA